MTLIPSLTRSDGSERSKRLEWTEIKQHRSRGSCWIVIDGSVYDVTRWLAKHPGGEMVIINSSGVDVTDLFNAYHPETVRRTLSSFYIGKVEGYDIGSTTKQFRNFAQSIENSPLMVGNPLFYAGLLLWYSLLLSSSISCVIFGKDSFILSVLIGGTLMALYFQQIAFCGHDLGHNSVFHNRPRDSALGMLLGNALSGVSMGWWKANHNAHHCHTNSVVSDPDIQHLPFIAVTDKFFHTVFSSYYEKELSFDTWGRYLIPLQAKLYYLIMACARFNLYVQSYSFLLRKPEYSSRRIRTNRFAEILGLLVFLIWWSCLLLCFERMSWMITFMLVSHGLAGILHVQITLSHFSMPVYGESSPIEHESFLEHQVKTCLDIDCSPILDFFHGGLQFQLSHHLFPRVPRCNLRTLSAIVRAFCASQGLQCAHMDFLSANRRMLAVLESVAQQSLCRASKKHDIAQKVQLM